MAAQYIAQARGNHERFQSMHIAPRVAVSLCGWALYVDSFRRIHPQCALRRTEFALLHFHPAPTPSESLPCHVTRVFIIATSATSDLSSST